MTRLRFFTTHWQLNLCALLFICLFTKLGCWQLTRAHEKKMLLQTYADRHQQCLSMQQLLTLADPRFYKLKVRGQFDDAHTIFLDNQFFHGQVGYQIYTPFLIDGIAARLLIHRGFVAMGPDRANLPTVKKTPGKSVITGWLTPPSRTLTLGTWLDSSPTHFPIRVEIILPKALAQLLAYPVYPYVLQLESTHPSAYPSEWTLTTMRPEKHQAYALQWFALALCLLILSLVLNFKQHQQ